VSRFQMGKRPGEIFFAVGAQVLEENVAESHFADTGLIVHAESFLHARLVNGIDALRRDAYFVERQADGVGLLLEEFAADAVHADAVVGFGHGGQECDDAYIR
jgi:hypothetical protein